MEEGRQKGGRCRCGGAPTCNVTQLIYSTIILKLIYLKELDMLFAISYDDSEVINNVSCQQPFQFIKQTVVIKYNIPSALVESQESLSLTCDFEYFHEV